MSKVIDLAINTYIYDNAFSNEEILNCSDNLVETLNLINFLSEEEMKNFVCCKIDSQYYITVEGVGYTVNHQDLSIALCLACLSSVGLDKEYIRDIKFEYNFDRGLL